MQNDCFASIAVVGGGASGLVAAISAGRILENEKIIIIDTMDRIGKKIMATGNGRCNIGNKKLSIEQYHGDKEFAETVFEKFDAQSNFDFFGSLGLMIVPDSEGRVYPFSGQASSVVDVLRFEIDRLNIETKCRCEVISIDEVNDGFRIRTTSGHIYAKKVIIATGGLAAPELGSSGRGYELLGKMSHTLLPTYPALVQLKIKSEYPRQLKGIRFNGELAISVANEVRGRERGEIMFTEYGISGIPTFQLSRIVSEQMAINSNSNVDAIIDFMSGYDKSDIYHALVERAKRNPDMTMENFFVGMFHKRIGQIICKVSGISPLSKTAGTLVQSEVENMVNNIKSFRLPVTGTKGFSAAQVTAGGISTLEFNVETMESNFVEGIYAAGEILNVDGNCGGYNLMWAWSSGRLAGESAAKSLIKDGTEEYIDFFE